MLTAVNKTLSLLAAEQRLVDLVAFVRSYSMRCPITQGAEHLSRTGGNGLLVCIVDE